MTIKIGRKTILLEHKKFVLVRQNRGKDERDYLWKG